ncbi:MAG: hypothetical protein M2R45_02970 [Verrucomicrobia subdivision 3 bacterium]|nr:hypothetical protein [Limisphaerales bacterium]MCS1415310.1 hypothetical protein [Limisphaerales bacterium]
MRQYSESILRKEAAIKQSDSRLDQTCRKNSIVFQDNEIPAAVIHLEQPNHDDLIEKFRNNELAVAFMVDLFNESVDFLTVQVFLFIKLTESKTVFVQQLGRGLRLAPVKIVLRF